LPVSFPVQIIYHIVSYRRVSLCLGLKVYNLDLGFSLLVLAVCSWCWYHLFLSSRITTASQWTRYFKLTSYITDSTQS